MSDLADRLWDVLDSTPSTREELIEELGANDRTIRRAVKELRDRGYNVATDSDTGGYWRGNEIDKRRTINELRARAYKELATAEALELGPEANAQMTMDLIME